MICFTFHPNKIPSKTHSHTHTHTGCDRGWRYPEARTSPSYPCCLDNWHTCTHTHTCMLPHTHAHAHAHTHIHTHAAIAVSITPRCCLSGWKRGHCSETVTQQATKSPSKQTHLNDENAGRELSNGGARAIEQGRESYRVGERETEREKGKKIIGLTRYPRAERRGSFLQRMTQLDLKNER